MANRSRKTRGGRGASSGLGKWTFMVLLLAGIFAFYQVPHNPTVSGMWNILVAKSETVEKWVQGVVSGEGFVLPGAPGAPGNAGGGSGGGSGGVNPPKGETLSVLDSVASGEPQKVAYDRKEWKHWVAVNGCWDTREQVLFDEAVPGSIQLLDKGKKPTTDVGSACSVAGGKWVDPYTGQEMTDPSKIDIDHMIPLSWAAKHGGQGWDAQRKQDYANSLGFVNHLVAASPEANRTKGDKGPSEWKPSNQDYWCSYATSWTTILAQWGLSVGSADKAALKEMLATC